MNGRQEGAGPRRDEFRKKGPWSSKMKEGDKKKKGQKGKEKVLSWGVSHAIMPRGLLPAVSNKITVFSRKSIVSAS